MSVLVYPFVKNKVSRAHGFLFFQNSLPLRVWQCALANEPSAQNCQNNHFPTLEKALRSIYTWKTATVLGKNPSVWGLLRPFCLKSAPPPPLGRSEKQQFPQRGPGCRTQQLCCQRGWARFGEGKMKPTDMSTKVIKFGRKQMKTCTFTGLTFKSQVQWKVH